jgi:hypothetical protein
LSDGATHTSPIETVASRSNWCTKLLPLFSVLSSPPDALATQYVLESASKTLMAVMRPPMFAGPMQRQVIDLTQSDGSVTSGAGGGTFLATSWGWPLPCPLPLPLPLPCPRAWPASSP